MGCSTIFVFHGSFPIAQGLFAHSCGTPEAYLNTQGEYTLLETRKDRNNFWFVISRADADSYRETMDIEADTSVGV